MNSKAICLSFLAALAVPAFACSTIVVGRNASATGRVIVGHNEDDPGETYVSHWMVPAREHPAGTLIPSEGGRARIPQVAKTFGFYWSEVKEPVGGMPNADTLFNEKGVLVVSNNGFGGRPDEPAAELTDGGIGYNLRRAVAERAANAREAMEVVTNLVMRWGYWMPGRNYTVADRDEAWVIALAKGRRFVARRCPDDGVVVIPNGFTIRTLGPDDILSPAVAAKFAADPAFDFAKTYENPARWESPYDTFRWKHMFRIAAGARYEKDYPFSAPATRKVSVEDVRAALSTHYEGTPDEVRPKHGLAAAHSRGLPVCRTETIECTLCAFGETAAETELQVATGSPCETPFRRFRPFGEGLPAEMSVPGDAAERLENHCRPMSYAELAAARGGTERPYAFRRMLETVHEPGRRDAALRPSADEFVFRDGMAVGDADFADYLYVSMGVTASPARGDAVRTAIDSSLKDREYVVDVKAERVEIRAKDMRALHQAYYHLEDLMNLRRAPFLKVGSERRRPLFSPRMVHSGWGLDVFPDAHLLQMAHAGIDAILIFLKDVDSTQGGGEHAGVNDIIERALRCGVDTYLYSKVQGFAHPDDPAGAAVLRDSFGRVAAAHPKAKGIVFVGESCQFPSRDPRVQPVRHQDRDLKDPRPLAGWFPCRDYPDWLNAVRNALHEHAPGMEIVFWTYNWSRQPVEPCADLIGKFPDGVAILSTFGKGEETTHRNGLVNGCRDYTISCPGPTRHFSAEAKAAGANGRRLYAMSNTGGLTWDFGVIPYQPVPYQWKRRWDALRRSNAADGLSGLMESHHYGWHPSFVSELAKEAFTEGGMPFDEHIRRIAARDFGEANADRVLAVWKRWSEAAADYVATNENQYGPFRVGPAYPFAFGGRPVDYPEYPQSATATFVMRWMAYLNYPYDQHAADLLNITYNALPEKDRVLEMELLESARTAYADGADELRRIAATLDADRRFAAERLAGIGAFMSRTTGTAINLRRGYAAFAKGDMPALLEVAKAEYANASAALRLVEADSRLGWEPSMEYAGRAEQIRWKLERMVKTYGATVRNP